MRQLPLAFLLSAGLAACASHSHSQARPDDVGQIAANAAAPAPNPAYLRRGYEPVVQKGHLMYCRKQHEVGSWMPNTVCLSEEEMKKLDAGTTIEPRPVTAPASCRPGPEC
jgi:hypothetical protein